jgi:hypothetical protein
VLLPSFVSKGETHSLGVGGTQFRRRDRRPGTLSIPHIDNPSNLFFSEYAFKSVVWIHMGFHADLDPDPSPALSGFRALMKKKTFYILQLK